MQSASQSLWAGSRVTSRWGPLMLLKRCEPPSSFLFIDIIRLLLHAQSLALTKKVYNICRCYGLDGLVVVWTGWA